MKAAVGDQLLVASSVVDGPVREGKVVEVRHPDGSPPFVVEWHESGERSLVFPGPDARLVHFQSTTADGAIGASASTGTTAPEHSTWRIQVNVSHEGPDTTAQAVLVAGSPDMTNAAGSAHLNPADNPSPAIGEEVAVARALRHLADRLVALAEARIEGSTGRPAHVR